MQRQYKGQILDIRYSCLTGRAVWLHTGPSKGAVWTAYSRACSREVERMRNWREMTAERKSNVMRLLNDCLAGQPLMEELPPEKKAAVKELLEVAKNRECDREFYEHVMEERKRREEDHQIRLQMRERENNERNGNREDKSGE
jgi:predicted Fe-S protein YdhL (DUF1289 family)